MRLLRFPKIYKMINLTKVTGSHKSLDRYITLNRFFRFFDISEGFIEVRGQEGRQVDSGIHQPETQRLFDYLF